MLRSRRAYVLLALVLALPPFGFLLFQASRGASRRPNIVLFVWDTCRPDRLSAYGYSRPTTPRLEEFARDGVTFLHAYAPSPWTPPSHASLFTGLLPSRHGLTQGEGEGARVRPGVPLLAQTLSVAGYETVGFTCNSCLSMATGLDAGFGRMEGLYVGEPVKGSGEKARRAVADWLAARKTGAGGGDRPLFLFVNLMDAHIPRTPSREAVAAVRGPGVEDADLARAAGISERDVFVHTLGVRRVDAPTLAGARTLYDATCRQLDDATGAILDLLKGEGLLDGAILAITADHGEALDEHGELGHRMSVYDPLLHVPMVVRWPGRLDGGRREERQVRLQDLYPTFLEAAGVPLPAGTGADATSLLARPLQARPVAAAFDHARITAAQLHALLPGEPDAILGRFGLTYLAAQDPIGTPGARKYVRILREAEDGKVTLDREELFDLAADPGETRNLLAPGGPPEARAAADRLLPLATSGR